MTEDELKAIEERAKAWRADESPDVLIDNDIPRLIDAIHFLKAQLEAKEWIIRALTPQRDPDDLSKEQIENKHFGPR